MLYIEKEKEILFGVISTQYFFIVITEAEDQAASAAYQQYDPTCSAISERYKLLETLYFLKSENNECF